MSAPEAMTELAWLAEVEESLAFAAAGQPVLGSSRADELPPRADFLSAKSRKTVVDMVRVHGDLEAGNNVQRNPGTEELTPGTLRAVAPAGNARLGKKTEQDHGITEAHGDDARNIPVPPREKLATHLKVKTRREQLENVTGNYTRDITELNED